MNRSGVALFVALIVVLLGGMVTVLATMVAMAEVRSGAAWRDLNAATALASSVIAQSRERAEAQLDSLIVGETVPLGERLSLLRLGDSILLLTVMAGFDGGGETSSRLLSGRTDSLGISRLTPHGSRARYHPIP